jgi:Zn-dependent protease with chaperone function
MMGFDKRQVMTFWLIGVVTFFAATISYGNSVSCGDIQCSPELSVGNFYFSTFTLALLTLQVIGIIVLGIALSFTKKKEHQSDAFATLAQNSPIFRVQNVNQNASPF